MNPRYQLSGLGGDSYFYDIMAKDSYWFRHDSSAGRGTRMRKLAFIYGHWGKGIYWDVIEMLRDQANYKYPSDEFDLKMLADLIGCKDDTKFINWFNDCVKYELFVIEKGMFYSEVLCNNMKRWEASKSNGSKGGRPDEEKPKPKPRNNLTDNLTTNLTETIREEKSIEDKNKLLLKKEPKEGINFSGLLGCINSAFSKKLKVINATTQKKFNARLKDGYSKDDIFNAITNASHDEFHKESNFKWCTPEYFSRSTTLDKYGFESQPVKAEKLIVPHYNENYPANLGDGTPA